MASSRRSAPHTLFLELPRTLPIFCESRGYSLMVKLQPSKLAMRVRFPLPALFLAGWPDAVLHLLVSRDTPLGRGYGIPMSHRELPKAAGEPHTTKPRASEAHRGAFSTKPRASGAERRASGAERRAYFIERRASRIERRSSFIERPASQIERRTPGAHPPAFLAQRCVFKGCPSAPSMNAQPPRNVSLHVSVVGFRCPVSITLRGFRA